MTDGKTDKKDMTGIFDLPPSEQTAHEAATNPFATETAIEKIDDFESIDQIGMMDHEPAPEAQEEPSLDRHSELPFEVTEAVHEVPPLEMQSDANFEPVQEAAKESPTDFLHDLKTYSEHAKTARYEAQIHYPFHLYIQGEFGPYERDKLLLFITENQIGLNSNDLDLQLKAGRTLFPRISEYAGIKIIQELRDSGLQFKLKPSPQNEESPAVTFAVQNDHYENPELKKFATIAAQAIPILATTPQTFELYEEFDSLEVCQYLKADMVEAEKSELFQEVVERMMDSLKQKARIKGGHALTRVERKTNPLRLPSQYQVLITATLLRKR